jgi:hypothetical protein
MNQRDDELKDSEPPRHPGLIELVGSVMAAGFGVQSSKNRERDFKHGKARVYIIAGIAFTVIFVATVFGVVSVILDQAGH